MGSTRSSGGLSLEHPQHQQDEEDNSHDILSRFRGFVASSPSLQSLLQSLETAKPALQNSWKCSKNTRSSNSPQRMSRHYRWSCSKRLRARRRARFVWIYYQTGHYSLRPLIRPLLHRKSHPPSAQMPNVSNISKTPPRSFLQLQSLAKTQVQSTSIQRPPAAKSRH